MPQFTVRNIEDEVKNLLKPRVVRNKPSLEAEARDILRIAVKVAPTTTGLGLGSRIAARFAKVGLIEALPELRGQQPKAFKLRP
jgi:antitoxin FitA